MPNVVAYLDCGCAIMEGGGTIRCPSCEVSYDQGIRDVLRIRCLEHRDIPAYNRNEARGGECAACAVEAAHMRSASELSEAHAQLWGLAALLAEGICNPLWREETRDEGRSAGDVAAEHIQQKLEEYGLWRI